jgi:hypothetical protein
LLTAPLANKPEAAASTLVARLAAVAAFLGRTIIAILGYGVRVVYVDLFFKEISKFPNSLRKSDNLKKDQDFSLVV